MTETVHVADGRELAYEHWGDRDGSPVFVLHGTPGCRFDRPIGEEELRAAGLHVLTYDRPGYGRSDRNRGRRVADCVGDVEAIADAAGLERFAVTGGSGGGPHALATGALLADRVTKVSCRVGVAPYGAEGLDWVAGMDPENVKEFGWALSGEEHLTEELERAAADALMRVEADPSTILEGFELPEADVAVLSDARVQELIRQSAAEMFASGVGGWVDDDLAFTWSWGFDVGDVKVPVEVCFGDSDVLVPQAHGEWLASHIPGASRIVESAKGHMMNPTEMIDHLRRFIFD